MPGGGGGRRGRGQRSRGRREVGRGRSLGGHRRPARLPVRRFFGGAPDQLVEAFQEVVRVLFVDQAELPVEEEEVAEHGVQAGLVGVMMMMMMIA